MDFILNLLFDTRAQVTGIVLMGVLGVFKMIKEDDQSRDNSLIALDRRVQKIEDTYVSRADLNAILDRLESDIHSSFRETHRRIDGLYRRGDD